MQLGLNFDIPWYDCDIVLMWQKYFNGKVFGDGWRKLAI